MLIHQQLLARTAERYRERSAQRSVASRRHDWKDAALRANTKEQINRRLDRIALPHSFGEVAPAAVLGARRTPGAAMDLLGYERILGRSDLVGIHFLEAGFEAARSVARIVLRDATKTISGYGTGFLVAPRLLLTNNHVLDSPAAASAAEIQFNYEDGLDGRMKASISFKLDPGALFVTSPELDYSLVAVAASALELQPFGFNRLIADEGKVLVGEFVNVIQHPNGEPKQLAIRENQVVDLLELFLHYETDTAPGSSGSPVFNDQWEVVCLHHSGVPAMKDGQFVTVDDQLWTPDMGEHRIKWIANEGVRVSRIAKDIEARVNGRAAVALVETMSGARRAPRQNEVLSSATSVQVAGAPEQRLESGATWTLPLAIALEFDGGGGPLPVTANGGPHAGSRVAARVNICGAAAPLAVSVEEGARREEEYRDRRGYDPLFLGIDRSLPLPGLGAWVSDAAEVLGAPPEAPFLLRYTNFSVVLSASRRMPLLTAVNIDGSARRALPRRGEAWYFDPRVRREFQVGNELYAGNPLDRRHMVRRVDPVWGSAASVANEDTFHYTNACPQHTALQQRVWDELESHILDIAIVRNSRASVFSGPVSRGDDPAYRGIRVPREFWKVAAVVDDDTGNLAAAGYLLTQSTPAESHPAFGVGALVVYQVPISWISHITGLDLTTLQAADAGEDASRLDMPSRWRRIDRASDVSFRRLTSK